MDPEKDLGHFPKGNGEPQEDFIQRKGRKWLHSWKEYFGCSVWSKLDGDWSWTFATMKEKNVGDHGDKGKLNYPRENQLGESGAVAD